MERTECFCFRLIVCPACYSMDFHQRVAAGHVIFCVFGTILVFLFLLVCGLKMTWYWQCAVFNLHESRLPESLTLRTHAMTWIWSGLDSSQKTNQSCFRLRQPEPRTRRQLTSSSKPPPTVCVLVTGHCDCHNTKNSIFCRFRPLPHSFATTARTKWILTKLILWTCLRIPPVFHYLHPPQVKNKTQRTLR